MPEKPKAASGKTRRKRKHEDVRSADGEDGYPTKQNKTIEEEKTKPHGVDEDTNKIDDELEDVDRMLSAKFPTPNQEILGRGQLVHLTLDETDDIYPTILPSLYQSSAARTDRSFPVQSSLCQRCANLDLDTLLSRPHKTCAGQSAKDLSPVSTWKIDSCTLCSLFHSTIVPSLGPELGRKVPLRTFSSNKMKDKVWSSVSTNLLNLEWSRRYIVSQPEGIKGPVKIIKEGIATFEYVKAWISLCSSRHDMCLPEIVASIPCGKLIDSLSYVWGCGSEIPDDPYKLPANLPDTIEDSITVTKRLGYHYLWVDRYCIDQKNEEETADQVGKMGLIYQNAELTIIAAIGDDPSYGLPGVGQRKRKPENLTACAKIDGHFLISTDAYPKSAVEDTKWETRAWTYQEALLSRRRLVFSEQQIFFECYGMYCCESLNFPLESLHRKDMQGFKSVFCFGKGVGIFPKGVGTTPIEIIRRIEEYSKLHLTNPSDILKGMLGIFHAFQSPLGIHHCAGVPLLPSIPERYAGKPIEGWTKPMGFFTGLFWDLKTRSDRRNGFPSWSWTGWQGPVKWGGAGDPAWPSIKVDPRVKVWVELSDGQLPTLDTYWADCSHSPISNTIHITAWIIGIKILQRKCEKGKDAYEARLKLEDGGCLEWRFESTSKVGISPGESCKGIILGHDFGGPELSGASTGPAVLVCGKVGDAMERIGLGWVDQCYYDRYDKDGVWEFKGKPVVIRVNPLLVEPLELVKSWEKIQLG